MKILLQIQLKQLACGTEAKYPKKKNVCQKSIEEGERKKKKNGRRLCILNVPFLIVKFYYLVRQKFQISGNQLLFHLTHQLKY